MMAQGKKIDLTGKQFGDLIVIKETKVEDKVGSFWLCKCSCGNETIIRGSDLKNKKTLWLQKQNNQKRFNWSKIW